VYRHDTASHSKEPTRGGSMTRSKIVFELTQPGTWLDTTDQRQAFRTGLIVEMTLTAFYELNAALWLFEDAFDRAEALKSQTKEDGYWATHNRRRYEIEQELQRLMGRTPDLYDQADLIFRREQWAQGTLPRKMEAGFLGIQAHAFLHALDQVGQLLAMLGAGDAVPAAARVAAQQFGLDFPQVGQIRKSTALREELARNGTPLRPSTSRRPPRAVPELNSLVSRPGLYGRTLTHASADGDTVSLDITSGTVSAVRDLMQGVLDAFTWKGPYIHYPT
jgi:hypothetical protein